MRKNPFPKASMTKIMTYLPPGHFAALCELQDTSRWSWNQLILRGLEVLYEFPELRQGVSPLGPALRANRDEIKRVMCYSDPPHTAIAKYLCEELGWSMAGAGLRGIEVLHENQDLIFKKFTGDLSGLNK